MNTRSALFRQIFNIGQTSSIVPTGFAAGRSPIFASLIHQEHEIVGERIQME
ncbi:MAG: hypothetical protein AAGU11_14575 [Syntrophobacteraceae bacterium]